MKANRKFFIVAFILNMILGAAEGGIFWAIWAIGAASGIKYIIEISVCTVIFGAMAFLLNKGIVKRSKLKIGYSAYGTIVNIVFFALVAAVLPFCFGFTLVF